MDSKRTGIIIFSAAIVVTVIAVVFALARPAQRAEHSAVSRSSNQTVAVIYLTGPIAFGSPNALFGGSTAEQTMRDLERATNDRGLKAVVLRIDSPGGSPAASQELNDQVKRLKASGKKVVASFGDTAASGGYFVAVAADKIVAVPSTLTGSIGVVATIPNLQDLYRKIGYKEQIFKSGPHKDMLSPNRPITPEEADIMQGIINDTYEQFVQVVSDGRKLPVERVRELADGRVYTGAQAKQLGLVDELGGQHEAVALAGKLAGIESPQAVDYYKPGWSDFFKGLDSLGNIPDWAAVVRLLGQTPQQLPPAYTTLKY